LFYLNTLINTSAFPKKLSYRVNLNKLPQAWRE